jgi:hypothetical protein
MKIYETLIPQKPSTISTLKKYLFNNSETYLLNESDEIIYIIYHGVNWKNYKIYGCFIYIKRFIIDKLKIIMYKKLNLRYDLYNNLTSLICTNLHNEKGINVNNCLQKYLEKIQTKNIDDGDIKITRLFLEELYFL